eukprot:TRINITY_DN12563_c0_g1_i12.p2 TRINITY_DN12563_c0_g1~~TRINITY_DN12563_c0_g1_i12.p2  ORF type:complete len:114 (+),score=27.11 TRINITY_DN12563_c0_g1_i12:70-411(+)
MKAGVLLWCLGSVFPLSSHGHRQILVPMERLSNAKTDRRLNRHHQYVRVELHNAAQAAAAALKLRDQEEPEVDPQEEPEVHPEEERAEEHLVEVTATRVQRFRAQHRCLGTWG